MSIAHEQGRLWTVLELIRWGSGFFQNKGIESGRLTMELLLCNVLSSTRIALYADFERPLTSVELDKLRAYVRRIAQHEPLQYVLGEASFYSLTFEVTPDVLIPRPETEFLVETAISVSKKVHTCLDIGTGSGAIAVSIAVHAPNTQWLCIDKSSHALAVAERNAIRQNVQRQCTFQQMDILTQAPSKMFDLICMNPPYVSAHEVVQLEPVVRDYEPHIALTDDADGLTFYRRLAELSKTVLADHGILLLEIGWGQSAAVKDIFHKIGEIAIVNDLADIPRVVKVAKE